jgi:hypothetical protein
MLVVPALAQDTKESDGPPDIEVVKFQVSVQKPLNAGSPIPKADPASVQQRHIDEGGRPERVSGGLPLGERAPGDRTPRPTDTSTPRYDRQGNVNQGSDSYWADGAEIDAYIFYASLTLKNNGEKTVKSVKWAYVVFDAQKKKEMKRELFESKKKIAPGETVTLLKEVRPSKQERKAEILEVLYADGSSWKRS